MSKCSATTKAGKPCNYKAKVNGLCGRHKNYVSIDDLTKKVAKMKIVEDNDWDDDWDEYKPQSSFMKRLLGCKGGDEIADLLMESPSNSTQR